MEILACLSVAGRNFYHRLFCLALQYIQYYFKDITLRHLLMERFDLKTKKSLLVGKNFLGIINPCYWFRCFQQIFRHSVNLMRNMEHVSDGFLLFSF